MSARTVKVILRAEVNQFKADMAAAAAASEAAAKRNQTAWDKSTSHVGKLTKGIQQNRQAMTEVGAVMAGFGAAVAGLGIAATKSGIEFNSLNQTATAALKSVTGSAAAAKLQMDKLNEFGRGSWVMRDSLLRAQQTMTGFGIEVQKVIPYMDALQEAVAASGGSNQDFEELARVMGKVESSGKITAETFNEFGTRGVDAAQLIGEAMGKTAQQIREEVTDGTLRADEALDALAEGMKTKFDGATENLRDTFRGAMDNLSAAWRDFSASLASPLVDPSGGGVAVTLINHTADALGSLRAQLDATPDAAKLAALGISGIAAAAGLAGGGFLILAPRILDTVEAVGQLSRMAPKTTGSILAMGRVAGVAAAGIAAIAVSAKLVDDGLGKMANDVEASNELKQLADDANLSRDALDEMFTASGNSMRTVQGFGDAVRAVDAPAFTRFLEFAVGFFGIFDTKASLATEQLQKFDEMMAQAAVGGDFNQVTQAFQAATDSASEFGYSAEDVLNQAPLTKEALMGQAEAMGLATDDATLLSLAMGELEPEMYALAGSAGMTGEAFYEMSEDAVAASDLLSEVYESALTATQGFVDFAESATNADLSLDGWIKSMEEQAEAQAKFIDNLNILRERGAPEEMITFFEQLGTEGAFRLNELADSSEEQLERAAAAFTMPTDAATNYAAAVVEIPDLNLDADPSELLAEVWIAEQALIDLEAMEPSPTVNAKITLLEDKLAAAKEQLGDLDNDGAMPTIGVSGADTTKGEIKDVHDALLNIPGDATSAVGVTGYEDAMGKIANLGDALSELDQGNNVGMGERIRRLWDRRLGKDEAYKRAAERAEPRAAGGIDFFAAGGFMDPIAQMVPPNTWRVVGDRSDVPEAFIPLDGSARSRQILLETMRRMPGMDFMASGGISSAQKNLRDAEAHLEKVTNRGRKVTDQDRQREAAQKRVASARAALQRAEEAERKRAEAERKEAERRARVREMQSSLRTDVRRGNIRDQVTGSLSGGYSAVDRLFGLGENKDLSRSARSTATASARRFESDLRRLYGQAERVEEKLKDAQETAKELEGIQRSVANSITGNAYSLDVTSQWSQNAKGVWSQTSGVSGVRTNAAAAAARAKELATKLGRLQKMGYAGAILQEVAQAGSIDASIEMADALLEGTGADVKSINASYSSIEKYAAQAGKYVTGGFYKGGVDAAQGVVKGLESQQASIEKQIESLAKGMEAVFKQVLGIRSPSRVMAELGEYTVEGLVRGMLSGQSDVTNAASLLAGAAVPAIALDVKASPVMDTDALAATSAMQDMSAVTLQAMQMMRADVAAGWDSMLSDTQSKQFSMRDVTAQQQEQMRAVILGKQTAAKDSLALMQESMRSTVADRQLRMRDNIASQQESMRSVMADKQSQMRDKNRTEFESMRATTGEKLTSMRSSADTTMTGFKGDYDSHMGSLKRINRDGHASMEDASESAFKGIRSGMNTQMRDAKPELGGKMNNLIDVLAKFTSSVNKAFGDVGVDLSSPQKLSFATGGVMPGYTPGRDVHSFYSPTAGSLYLSGGEAIMRPEFTRAVGGEKGVKELNDAARRGDHEHLDLAMHFAQGGVMPVSAPMRGVNAFADSGVWRGLWSIVRSAFPHARKTSDYRGGSRTASGNQSYHSRGMAVDLAGRYQMDTSTMGQIAEWLVGNYGGSNEIIYSPLNGRQVKNGRNYMYTGAVRGMHYNHVHWANQSVPGGATGGPSGAWDGDVWIPHPFLDKAGVSADGDLEAAYERAAKKQISAIIGKHTGQLSGGEFSRQLGAGIMRATRDGLIKKATDYGELMGDGGIPGAANGPVKQMAREVLEKMGWGDQWADLDWLVTRESGWNPNAQNPTSTAYGLFQFLDGTWGSVGATKTSDPLKQIQAGLKYIQQRYGDVRGARRFWERNNWYKDGTKNAKSGWAVVGEEGPELINLGGGERIESNPQTRKALAANRTFLPTQSQQIDFDKLGQAIAKALPNQDIAAALNGAQMTLNVDGKAMTGFVHTAVASGYSESRSRLSKSSSKVGAR